MRLEVRLHHALYHGMISCLSKGRHERVSAVVPHGDAFTSVLSHPAPDSLIQVKDVGHINGSKPLRRLKFDELKQKIMVALTLVV